MRGGFAIFGVTMFMLMVVMLAMRNVRSAKPGRQMDVSRIMRVLMIAGHIRPMRMVPAAAQQQVQGQGDNRE